MTENEPRQILDYQRLILLCARTHASEPINELIVTILEKDLDWPAFLKETLFCDLAPLIWRSLSPYHSLIPRTVSAVLLEHSRMTVARNLFLSRELEVLCELFVRHGIRFVPVKGIILAEIVYGSQDLREMIDLDILVFPQDLSMAVGVLEAAGFQPHAGKEAGAGRDVYLQGRNSVPYSLELHWKFKDSFLRLPIKGLWSDLTKYTWRGRDLQVFSPELTLVHLTHHLHYEGYPLKILVDVAETLRANQEILNWSKILKMVREWRMERNFGLALQAVSSVLKYAFPEPAAHLKSIFPERSWLTGRVTEERWYFNKTIYRFRSNNYLRAAYSSFFIDGTNRDWTKVFLQRLFHSASARLKRATNRRSQNQEFDAEDLPV